MYSQNILTDAVCLAVAEIITGFGSIINKLKINIPLVAIYLLSAISSVQPDKSTNSKKVKTTNFKVVVCVFSVIKVT